MEELEKEVIINDLNRVEELKEHRDDKAVYEGFGLVTAVKIILAIVYVLLFWVFATMDEASLLIRGIMLVFISGMLIYLLKDLIKTPKEFIKLELKD